MPKGDCTAQTGGACIQRRDGRPAATAARPGWITINAATGVPGYLGSVSYDIVGNIAIQTNHGLTTNVFGNVDTNAVCLQLGGAGALANTFSHGPGAPDDFRLRKRFEASVRLPGYAGGTSQDVASVGQVVAFIQGQNTGSAGEPGSASASGTGGYTGGAACPLPP